MNKKFFEEDKQQFLEVPFEIDTISEKKADGKNYGIIKGLASTFGNIDKGTERVIKGAFKNTLQKYLDRERQIRMYFQHDYKNVIGGFDVYRETNKGLYVEGKINLDVQKGAETYSLAKQGVMTDFSIGYWIKDYEWTHEKVAEKDGQDIFIDVFNLKELDLTEISMVSNPMNDLAIVTSIKSCKTITDINRYLKSLGASNKESNEIISFIKSLCRDDDKDELNSESRDEVFAKVDNIKIVNEIDNVIRKIKQGL